MTPCGKMTYIHPHLKSIGHHDGRVLLAFTLCVCTTLFGLVHGAAGGTVPLWSLLGVVVVVFVFVRTNLCVLHGQSLARLGVGSHLQFRFHVPRALSNTRPSGTTCQESILADCAIVSSTTRATDDPVRTLVASRASLV